MLLPNEWIENSIETYIYQRTTRSQIIYWVVLLAVTATLIALPFVYVDISIQGNGIVRPVAEKAEVVSSVTEFVDSVYVREGEQIRKGDIILRLRTNDADNKIYYQTNLLHDYQSQIADLSILAKGECPQFFHSAVRKQEYAYFNKRKQELETMELQAKKEFDRNKLLYEKKVISEEEYDGYYFKWQNQLNELSSLTQSQLNTWQSDLNSYQNTYNEINTTLKQELKSKDMYIVRSPVDGTVDQFSGIYRGSAIQAGQSLAVISPDSTLCLEVYVSPRDIGFMNIGMPVRTQVESFNYNEWGSIPGEVTEISSDYLTDKQGNIFYKVKCRLERDYLELKNGKRGMLKKGMSVSAHFMVTRRSLFDLLYQSMDKWMNPTQYSKDKHIAKLK